MSWTVHDSLSPVQLTQGRAEATLAGETLASRYDVLELLGIGGMGAVYRARDRELDEMVALKVVRRELAEVPAMIERFRHEVKLARRVTHINVARTFELGTADGLTFCTMELIEGESLARRLTHGPMPIGEAVGIAGAVCDGLSAAHAAGVVHRDIKPDNILVAYDGRVVVADFGVAAVAVAGTGELSGTLAYMAPEQARGEPATPASDVFSLGVVLGQMIAGAIPPELAAVIAAATAPERDARITSAAALRRALEPWATPGTRTSQRMRVAQPADDIATVVVMAPHRTASGERQYLATAVHETVLARLAKTPRLRVLPRAGALTDKPTFGIELHMQDQLEVRITLETGASIFQKYPAAVGNVVATAEAIASTIEAELVRMEHYDDKLQAAHDLFWQARHLAYRDLTRVSEAIDMLQRARVLAPHDVRISATLAIAMIRAAFFRPRDFADALPEARLLATAAVTAAPALADGHIALGHLELTSGQPVHAASHFRMAIARAPHLAEAHEQLGRMLLEAGYFDLALARLDEALAIAPDLRSAKWEITRAYALDERWDEVDRMIADLRDANLDRPLSRARYAWWRGDMDTVRELRAQIRDVDRVLWPEVVDSLFGVFLDKQQWHANASALMAATDNATPNLRRRVFIAQLTCEAAAFAGDSTGVVELLEHAAAHGLFDLHWLDRCVLLRPYREVPGVVKVRKQIAARAEAILDALYGDHVAALSETQVA